jgi:stress response protein YsnF
MPNVIGIFDNHSQAQEAIEQMINDGIDRDRISLVSRGTDEEKGRDASEERGSGAGKGAGIGAAVGGVGGLIAGIAGLAIPGLGPILAAGPIAAAIGGALGGAGLGAAAGGIIGALTDMGVPEEEARHYENQIREGNVLVAVRAENDEEAERAANIMEIEGAEDVEGRPEESVESTPEYEGTRARETADMEERRIARETAEMGQPRTATDTCDTQEELAMATAAPEPPPVTATGAPMPPPDRQLPEESADAPEGFRTEGTATIPVTEEQMVVGKRTVEGGRVRIYGRTTEKPVEETVRLREDRVNVERRPADRPATDADREGDVVIEVTEMKEEPVVGKTERVVEEVVVGTTAEERIETVRDKVRRKDVEVEKTDTAAETRKRQRA